MHWFAVLSYIVVLFCISGANAHQDHGEWACATHEPSKSEFDYVQLEIDHHHAVRRRRLASKTYNIPVHFHMFTPPGSSSGVLSQQMLQTQIQHLNLAFKDFTFSLAQSTVHENRGHFNNVINNRFTYMPDILQALPEEPHKLHIFTGNDASNVLGMASFPWNFKTQSIFDGVSIILDVLKDSGGSYDQGMFWFQYCVLLLVRYPSFLTRYIRRKCFGS